MIKLKDLFGQDKIEIFSPNPNDLTDSKDIKALILWKYPNVIAEYLVVSQPHANTAILVGDNINYTGWVEVFIKKNKFRRSRWKCQMIPLYNQIIIH